MRSLIAPNAVGLSVLNPLARNRCFPSSAASRSQLDRLEPRSEDLATSRLLGLL